MYLLCTFMGRSFLSVCLTSVSGCSGPKRKKFFEVIISVFFFFFFFLGGGSNAPFGDWENELE
jgi:hypothetical protein